MRPAGDVAEPTWPRLEGGDDGTDGDVVEAQRPRLFWISVSYLADVDSFVDQANELYDAFREDVTFVIGGREMDASIRRRVRFDNHCDNLEQLRRYASSLLPRG